jgi:hypothetical protein
MSASIKLLLKTIAYADARSNAIDKFQIENREMDKYESLDIAEVELGTHPCRPVTPTMGLPAHFKSDSQSQSEGSKNRYETRHLT